MIYGVVELGESQPIKGVRMNDLKPSPSDGVDARLTVTLVHRFIQNLLISLHPLLVELSGKDAG